MQAPDTPSSQEDPGPVKTILIIEAVNNLKG